MRAVIRNHNDETCVCMYIFNQIWFQILLTKIYIFTPKLNNLSMCKTIYNQSISVTKLCKNYPLGMLISDFIVRKLLEVVPFWAFLK